MDVVYTFVASNDEKWQKKYEKYKGNSFISEGNNRYNYCGEIIASLLFLQKNVINVRKIFIVSDDQKLDIKFLSKKIQNKIRFIDHKQIIPNKYLPTFNSTVIETFLWKIPHLSQYFIYLNDDVFINKKVNLQKLRGKIYCNLYNLSFNNVKKSSYPLVNAKKLFLKYYPNKNFYVNRKHVLFILNRNICRFVFNKMKNELSKICKYKFRKNERNKSVRFMSIVNSVSILKGHQQIIPYPNCISIQTSLNTKFNYSKYVYINMNCLSEKEIDNFCIILKKCGINLNVLEEKINSIKYIL